jgi:hypothetical protein
MSSFFPKEKLSYWMIICGKATFSLPGFINSSISPRRTENHSVAAAYPGIRLLVAPKTGSDSGIDLNRFAYEVS